jgi:hypothetical protein
LAYYLHNLKHFTKNAGNNMKYFNYGLIAILGITVIIMLSSFIMRISNPVIDSSIEDDIKITNQERIQISILNGCGMNGYAAKTDKFLKNYKFDTVEIGNYDKEIEKSIVIDRLGDIKSAKKVAYALGIADSLIVTEIDSSLFVRTTVVIGKDYKLLNPFN